MATYGNDEEQVEALKAWWNENGNSLLTGIVLVLVVFFGTRQWQSMQAADSGAASDLYQQIADLALENLTQPVTAEGLQAAQGVYTQLKTDHESSIYVRYAALALARFHVEQGNLDQAAVELQWVLDNPGGSFLREVDAELLKTVRLRLARINVAKGDAERALSLLRAVDPGTFAASYAEAEGDALHSLGQHDAARAAYQRALAGSTSENQVILRLKLQDLGVSTVDAF